jgi:hypothetical protein
VGAGSLERECVVKRELDLRRFIENIRSCCMATARTVKHERKKDEKFEESCYRGLFQQVFGRWPTPEELRHMTGGLTCPPGQESVP